MEDWKEFGGTWRQFRQDGLARPGVLIETRAAYLQQISGEEVVTALIGDINELGGVCDDCLGISHDELVVRYRTVWREVS